MSNNIRNKYLTFFISTILIATVFSVTITAISNQNIITKDDYINITVEEAWIMLNDASPENGIQIPIDVRTDDEWKLEHIDTPAPENPNHYPLDDLQDPTGLETFLSTYDGKEIILYCRTGSRSVTAANILVNNNFNGTIYNMLGGITAWKSEGYPTIGNLPPSTPEITGSTSGKPGKEYEYTLKSTDTDGNKIYYFVNWSDGTTETWIGPYASNEEVIISHAWEEKDTYTIKVKAKDYYGNESNWATLEVTIPKNKVFNYNFPFLNWLFERFPNAFPIIRILSKL